jgi:hypothetical protein
MSNTQDDGQGLQSQLSQQPDNDMSQDIHGIASGIDDLDFLEFEDNNNYDSQVVEVKEGQTKKIWLFSFKFYSEPEENSQPTWADEQEWRHEPRCTSCPTLT